jgi:hypothetical protein
MSAVKHAFNTSPGTKGIINSVASFIDLPNTTAMPMTPGMYKTTTPPKNAAIMDANAIFVRFKRSAI